MSEGKLVLGQEKVAKLAGSMGKKKGGLGRWHAIFLGIPGGAGKYFEGKRARVAWTEFHRLKRENKLPSMLRIKSEGLRTADMARVLVYWEASA